MESRPPTERSLSIAALGIRTRVLEAGAGPAVLLLHGNPDNADEWRPLMARLAPAWRCIAPDFPGYGRSPEPPASFRYRLAEQVRFIDAVLDALQVDGPIVLVVHDTGGMSGTAWAAANLGRLRGVVVTNTVAYENFAWFPIARTWGATSPLGRLRARLGMAAIGWRRGVLFKRIFGRQSPQLDSATLARFAQSFACNRGAKNTALRQFRLCTDPRFFDGFDQMWVRISASVPSRVLWGEGDPYLPAENAHRFGSAQVTVLPGVGHWVPLVAPDALAAQVAAVTAS
jgi:haloalkane dehalogenase